MQRYELEKAEKLLEEVLGSLEDLIDVFDSLSEEVQRDFRCKKRTAQILMTKITAFLEQDLERKQ